MVDRNHKKGERKKTREPLTPVVWPGVFESYSRSYVRRNQWRVSFLHPTPEDALQQCALIFCECLRLYEFRYTDPRHFMGVYKISLDNHFHKHAVRNAKRKPLWNQQDELEGADPGLSSDDMVRLWELWLSASPEVQQALTAISNGSPEFVEALLTCPPNLRDRVWSRLLGMPAGSLPATELVELLRHPNRHKMRVPLEDKPRAPKNKTTTRKAT